MDIKINNRLSYIQNRCDICIYQRYKCMKNSQSFTWQHVSKIIYYYDDTIPSCTICFCKPLLARMDRCGHIFCLSCILTLFEHAHGKHVLCPFCKDVEINLNSLKRIVFQNNKIPKIGDSIELLLLVKNKENISPRKAQDLSLNIDHVMPKNESARSKFLSVMYEKDYRVTSIIKSDMNYIKKYSKKNKYKNIYHRMVSFLNSELISFGNEIQMTEISEKSSEKISNNESFNLLLYSKENAQEKLFYQCPHFRFVYLDATQESFVINKALNAGIAPPVTILSKIVSMKTETLNNESLRLTPMNHLFPGVQITMIEIDFKVTRFMDIATHELTPLRNHQTKLIDDARQLEIKKQNIADKACQRKHLPIPVRVLSTNKRLSASNIGVPTKKPGNICYSFNTCTVGIECLMPDDDYPHAETCVFFTGLKIDSPTTSNENESEEKYFGLLRMKLNVYNPPQKFLPEDLMVKEKEEVKRSDNHPPELIEPSELLVAPENKLTQYLVQKKCGSQRQQKQLQNQAGCVQ